MSKFIGKLRHIYRGSTPSMGFRKSAEASTSPLLLVADLTKAGNKDAKAMAGADTDASIVSSESLDAKGFGQLVAAMGDVPLGLFLEAAAQQDIDGFIDSGCDFVVFDLNMPLWVVKKEGIGKILRVDSLLDQGLVRAINELPLPVDAVLVSGGESEVTIERLLVYQRFAELLDKPLLVALALSATSDVLASLYEAGVNGLVLPVGLGTEAFVELRKAIGNLPRLARRRTRGGVLIPRVGDGAEVEMEEEEEDI